MGKKKEEIDNFEAVLLIFGLVAIGILIGGVGVAMFMNLGRDPPVNNGELLCDSIGGEYNDDKFAYDTCAVLKESNTIEIREICYTLECNAIGTSSNAYWRNAIGNDK